MFDDFMYNLKRMKPRTVIIMAIGFGFIGAIIEYSLHNPNPNNAYIQPFPAAHAQSDDETTYDETATELHCGSEYVLKNLMEQITDINYPVLEFKEAHDTIKIEKDEIATLGQTFHGFVCDTIVKSYKNGDDQYIEKLEIYYRTDLNDDHHGISVESMEKEQAMVAR